MGRQRSITLIRKTALLFTEILLILVSSCGPGPTPIIISLTTTPESPTATPQPEETASPTSEFSTPTQTPFVPRAIIKIFSNVPLSGERAAFGQDILEGTALAIQQLSGPLNQSGYKVELVPFNDLNVRASALANADAIVADREILCGVGHYDSEITIAASDVYHLSGLALVAPAATAPLLTQRNYLEINRVVGREDLQGMAAAQFALAQGYASVYIIGQQAENSLRNAERFRTESSRLGIQWLGEEITELRDDNRRRIINKILAADPDVVYISSSASQAIPFLGALRAAGYNGALLGTDNLNDPALINLAGAPLTGGGGLFYTTMSPPPQYYSNSEQFIQDFRAQYGAAPLQHAAPAYDATGICLKAIESASTASAGELPTRAQVARAIRALDDYQGITGTYNFNRQGDPNPGRYFVSQVTTVDLASWDQNPIVASYDVTPP